MAQFKSHNPGNFCWFELATSDWKAAKKFYTGLLGLAAEEVPMGENQPPYVLLKKGGNTACALYQQGPDQTGIPPNWMTYVAVKSADESAAKAKKLGAKVIAEPFDVFDLGRMAVMSDPQGAAFSVWQPKKNQGVGVYGEPGSVCWSELQAADVEKAKRFYTQLFGWGAKPGADYTEWQNGGESIGGMMKKHEEKMPSMWWIYFAVDDIKASTKKAKSLGGKAFMELQDIENVGTFSLFNDPQGAIFYLLQLKP